MDSRLLMRWESIAILLALHDRRRKSDTQKNGFAPHHYHGVAIL